MTTKTAVVVLSDPSGGDEAVGRVFNALAAAKDFAETGNEVTVLFQGAGTRWAGVLADPGHPLHGLYTAVWPSIAGVSDACATFFDARDGAVAAGLDAVAEHHVDGFGDLPSLAALAADGFAVLTF
jgi:hypothetical protein